MTRTSRPLSPMERKTLRALEAAPAGLTREQLIEMLYAGKPNGPPKTAHTVIMGVVSRVRSALLFKTIHSDYGAHRYRMVDINAPHA